jgi:TRAP-type uncharacterized transport system fused permease subunit
MKKVGFGRARRGHRLAAGGNGQPALPVMGAAAFRWRFLGILPDVCWAALPAVIDSWRCSAPHLLATNTG